MKRILIFIFILIFSQIISAQTKIDEYGPANSDIESGKIDIFLINLLQSPESKGLIVIYSGENKERLGNILGQLEGIKTYISGRDKQSNSNNLKRISFIITEGKATLLKELWIAKKDKKFPEFKPIDLDLSNLTYKYLYAETCLACDPVVPFVSNELVNRELFGKTLKENKNFKGIIIVDKRYFGYAVNFRKDLIENFRLDVNRISIKFKKDDFGNAYFYIVPKMIENKRK